MDRESPGRSPAAPSTPGETGPKPEGGGDKPKEPKDKEGGADSPKPPKPH